MTLFEVKKMVEQQKGIRLDQQLITNIRDSLKLISGTTGGKEESAGHSQNLSDEKTLGELGLIGDNSHNVNVILKIEIDTNLITIRVNLNHSLHQQKPSGNHCNTRLFDSSGYSSAGGPHGHNNTFFEEILEL